MVRVCPKCNIKLGSNDYYFCSTCGEPLPENLSKPNDSVKQIIEFRLDQKVHKELFANFKPVFQKVSETLNLKGMAAAFFIGIIIVGIFLIAMFYLDRSSPDSNDGRSDDKATSPAIIKKATVDLDNVFKTHLFGADKIIEYIPSDVEVYIEAHDLPSFLDFFKVINPDYDSFSDQLKELAGEHFSIFITEKEGEFNWTIVTLNKAVLLENAGEEVKLEELEWLTIEEFEDVRIISTTTESVQNVKEAKQGTCKNLALNPAYVAAKQSLPKSGQVFVMTFSEKGKTFIKALNNFDLPEEIKVMVDSYTNTNKDFVVIY